MLAIKLNRTLVIPTFFIDKWGDGGAEGGEDDDGRILSGLSADFIDIQSLAQFIPIAEVDSYTVQKQSILYHIIYMIAVITQHLQNICKNLIFV